MVLLYFFAWIGSTAYKIVSVRRIRMAEGRERTRQMAVIIESIVPGSAADKAGVKPGEGLVSVNGHEIVDVLDYRFYMTEPRLTLVLRDKTGNERHVQLKKGEYDDPGLEFATYLMDRQRSCCNKCVFCFIDQLPPGMRESLYFKDDDARLSFLFGNYITLTNISDREIDRIIHMHISPVNISIHTTNPKLRCEMMGNRFAGDALRHVRRLAEAGIRLNCQLVLCPGLNDGDELQRSLDDLEKLTPALESIAVVPVGLTGYREGLYPLTGFDQESAGAVIDLVEAFGRQCLRKYGSRLAYPADEFYVKAGRPLPDEGFYGDFDQLENGVGLVTLLHSEFMAALKQEEGSEEPYHCTIATGVAAAPFLKKLVDEACKKWHNLKCEVIAIKNEFFGGAIDVAGLVTGRDLIRQLQGRDLGERLVIPAVMLRKEGDLFLDDLSVTELSQTLEVPVTPVPNDGWELLRTITGG